MRVLLKKLFACVITLACVFGMTMVESHAEIAALSTNYFTNAETTDPNSTVQVSTGNSFKTYKFTLDQSAKVTITYSLTNGKIYLADENYYEIGDHYFYGTSGTISHYLEGGTYYIIVDEKSTTGTINVKSEYVKEDFPEKVSARDQINEINFNQTYNGLYSYQDIDADNYSQFYRQYEENYEYGNDVYKITLPYDGYVKFICSQDEYADSSSNEVRGILTYKGPEDYPATYSSDGYNYIGTSESNNFNTYETKGTYYLCIGATKVETPYHFSLQFTPSPSATKVGSATRDSNTTATVAVDTVNDVTGYEIAYSPDKNFPSASTETLTTQSAISKLSNLKALSGYYVKARTYITYNNKNYYSDWSTSAFLKPGNPKTEITNAVQGASSISVSMKSMEGADGYEIEVSNDSSFKDSSSIYTSSSATAIIPDTDLSKIYYIRSRAFAKVGDTTYYGKRSDVVKAKVNLGKTTFTKIKRVSTKEVQLKAKSVAKASGYTFAISDNAKFTKNATTTFNRSSTAIRITGLYASERCYVRVRPYIVQNGKKKYGSYSDAQIVRPYIKRVTIKSAKKKKSKATISYKKVRGMSGYQICYATNKKFKNAKIVTSKKTSKTIKLKGKNTYVKVRAFVKYSEATYYGPYSKAKKVK